MFTLINNATVDLGSKVIKLLHKHGVRQGIRLLYQFTLDLSIFTSALAVAIIIVIVVVCVLVCCVIPITICIIVWCCWAGALGAAVGVNNRRRRTVVSTHAEEPVSLALVNGREPEQ